MNTDLFLTAGNLYWYRHKGRESGTKEWETTAKVGTGGWERFISVFAAADGVIYAIERDGRLVWSRHKGWQDGAVEWQTWEVVGTGGWENFKFVFAAGQGVIYAVDRTGNLHWYRHNGWQNGAAQWETSHVVAEGGWDKLLSVFSGGDGVIYAIDSSGNLRWYRHNGWQDGSGSWVNQGRAKIVYAGGWDELVSVFAAGDGVIYATDQQGDLRWYRPPAGKMAPTPGKTTGNRKSSVTAAGLFTSRSSPLPMA